MSMVIGLLLTGALFYLPLGAILYLLLLPHLRRQNAPLPRRLAALALACYLALVLFVTLLLYFISGGVQIPPNYYLYNLRPFVWITETYSMGWKAMVEQLALNVCMFVPLGLLLPMVFASQRRWYVTTGCCCLISLLIEVAQLFIGRSADVDDLIMNTAGALLGYGIFQLLHRLLKKKNWWQTLLQLPPQ
ncbi:MAG: VanZ family protein [Eubacteriales bacterium]|jgi:glycopeptide antibiotics resistance protein